jgi:hypothetical protein
VSRTIGTSTPCSSTTSPRRASSSSAARSDDRDDLIVVEAADEHEVEARLEVDPWLATEILRIAEIRPWTIWLDGGRAGRCAGDRSG